MTYDVTVLTVKPAPVPKALPRVQEALGSAGKLLACWYTEIGALNQIFLMREFPSAEAAIETRDQAARSADPFGIGEFMTSARSDTFNVLPFLRPIQTGAHGPFFEVRDYLLRPGALAGTIERWEKALPARLERSPLLTCMYSVSGMGTRFVHIWPYKTLDQRHDVRSKAVADKIWPPAGGGEATLITQQTEIYVPAPFSPIK